ncbi:tetratricopeptide repeat protein [Fimbriimonas ginsengisoli]|uniref:TPR repeat-containing protein n=1 Tax=Fimbriimonas ginsengisoli Gsoil 348 TaxID=661478 RepID=A0A068NUU5_FIMGI|nr:tetratricopeptide repeat protein [Fimbriimonas ginsengisoli]AIE85379.1 TPR repeat-containing protein [Fimbriimonas ginsengisoli Gsoil 348]
MFLAFGVAAFGGWMGYASWYSRPGYWATVSKPPIHIPFDSSRIDARIRTAEETVRRDPNGALGWSRLSSEYLARSRESDDSATAVKAEAAARKSLALRKLGNVGAWNKLVQSLLQQHRFHDALSQCLAAEKAKVSDDHTTRSHVECLIEVGRYDEARNLIKANSRAFGDASGKTIVARLLDIDGKPADALRLLQFCAREADGSAGMPSDAVAWFHTRTAIQLDKMGRHDESRREFQTALTLYPRDYKAMAGLARVAFQDGRWQEAIDWGTKSDAIAQMADVRALVGDAYALLGQPDKAEAQYAKVAELVGRPSGMNDGMHEVAPVAGTHGHRLDRQYAIFCADHRRDLGGAYAAALRDLESRRDIYAFDTLAWVCLQRGDKKEAVGAIAKALARGTRDPMLLFHAGTIYAAANDHSKADRYLKAAMAIDPNFDGVAARKMASLGGEVAHP